VPEEAVMLADRQASVFVIEDGRAERREIELGQREVGRVEVAGGLEAGERVAVTGLQRLRPGSAVTIVEPEAPAVPDETSGAGATLGPA
jgi:membrane fusion protein (multidrug efflux system)